MERTLVPPTGIRHFLVPMAPPTSIRGVFLLAAATVRALLVLVLVRPRVTVATGGYASTPAAVASWLLRIPIVLFLPDVFPGKAVAWLSPLARRIAVTSEVTARHFPPGKATVTGYPLRPAFSAASRDSGRNRFGLPPDATVVVVFGGSQGARHINQAVTRALPELLGECHILHICGEQRWSETQAASVDLAPDVRARYQLFPYLHEEDMVDALTAADLAVCRAGASVLGELPATHTPAILVPLPQLTVHQRENAEYLAEHGAAVILDDAAVDAELGASIRALLSDGERLKAMTEATTRLARPCATEAIVELIDEVGV